MKPHTVTLIAAVARDGCIGKDNTLPFRLPGDLKRFRSLTMGKPVIMGRRTWDSLPGRPLPGRLNIIISRSMPDTDGAVVARSVSEALEIAEAAGGPETTVIGGAEIYAQTLRLASRAEITHVNADVPGGDAFFPAGLLGPEWRLASETPGTDAGETAVTYRTYVRA
jgi:dihydrofolate reductase